MCQHSDPMKVTWNTHTTTANGACSFNVHVNSMAEVHTFSEPSQCALMPFAQTKSDKLLDDQDIDG